MEASDYYSLGRRHLNSENFEEAAKALERSVAITRQKGQVGSHRLSAATPTTRTGFHLEGLGAPSLVGPCAPLCEQGGGPGCRGRSALCRPQAQRA
jgi:hypothetical protein